MQYNYQIISLHNPGNKAPKVRLEAVNYRTSAHRDLPASKSRQSPLGRLNYRVITPIFITYTEHHTVPFFFKSYNLPKLSALPNTPFFSPTAMTIHSRTRGGGRSGSGDGRTNGCGVDPYGNERALYFSFSILLGMFKTIACCNNMHLNGNKQSKLTQKDKKN